MPKTGEGAVHTQYSYQVCSSTSSCLLCRGIEKEKKRKSVMIARRRARGSVAKGPAIVPRRSG